MSIAEVESKTAQIVSAPPFELNVTESAANEVKRIIAENSFTEKVYLRVRVQGGGCSGFQNKLDLDQNFNEKSDLLFDAHGIQVVVDKRSSVYLEKATIDFHNDLNKRGFSVTNPQAKSTCGCGSIYSL